MAFPDAWTEFAMITIEKANGTDFEWMAITETIDISEGDYPGESVMNIAGGRIWKESPQEDGEITLEMYPVQVAYEDDGGLFQKWVGGTIDSSEPLVSDISEAAGVDRPRDRFRVSILCTNDAAVGAADGTTAAESIFDLSLRSLEIGIGYNPFGGGSAWYDGLIDDVRIYNYALSVAQIRKLFNQDAAVRFGPSTGQP